MRIANSSAKHLASFEGGEVLQPLPVQRSRWWQEGNRGLLGTDWPSMMAVAREPWYLC